MIALPVFACLLNLAVFGCVLNFAVFRCVSTLRFSCRSLSFHSASTMPWVASLSRLLITIYASVWLILADFSLGVPAFVCLCLPVSSPGVPSGLHQLGSSNQGVGNDLKHSIAVSLD